MSVEGLEPLPPETPEQEIERKVDYLMQSADTENYTLLLRSLLRQDGVDSTQAFLQVLEGELDYPDLFAERAERLRIVEAECRSLRPDIDRTDVVGWVDAWHEMLVADPIGVAIRMQELDVQ